MDEKKDELTELIDVLKHQELKNVLLALASAIESIQKDVDMLVGQLQVREEIEKDVKFR